MNKEKLFELSIDKNSWQFTLDFNLKLLLIIALIIFVLYLVIRLLRSKYKNQIVKKDIVPVELSFEMGGLSTKYEIVRNYANIEIAYKIYIELITRKAAIEIDEENDVITEIYNSWYNLFKITRDELKNLTGDLLYENQKSSDLIKLAIDILNKGLRPHLTKYQAKFRKWFDEKLKEEEIKGAKTKKTPQQIQREYPEYEDLIKSMKDVNTLLIEYSLQLKKLINQK